MDTHHGAFYGIGCGGCGGCAAPDLQPPPAAPPPAAEHDDQPLYLPIASALSGEPIGDSAAELVYEQALPPFHTAAPHKQDALPGYPQDMLLGFNDAAQQQVHFGPPRQQLGDRDASRDEEEEDDIGEEDEDDQEQDEDEDEDDEEDEEEGDEEDDEGDDAMDEQQMWPPKRLRPQPYNESAQVLRTYVPMQAVLPQQQQQQQQQEQEQQMMQRKFDPVMRQYDDDNVLPHGLVETVFRNYGVLPKLTLCLRCLTRLEDMEHSPGFGCKKGAKMWKMNWVRSHKKCFGACQCDDFCVSHGYPVDQCIMLNRGASHKVTRYYGQWGDASTKNANPRMLNRDLVRFTQADAQDTTEAAAPAQQPSSVAPQTTAAAAAAATATPSKARTTKQAQQQQQQQQQRRKQRQQQQQQRQEEPVEESSSDDTAVVAATGTPPSSAVATPTGRLDSPTTSSGGELPALSSSSSPSSSSPSAASSSSLPPSSQTARRKKTRGRDARRAALQHQQHQGPRQQQHRLEGQSAYLVPAPGRPAIEYSPTFPCDCCTRLSRLLAVHWIENSLELVHQLRQRVEESKTRCLGFCQSCYLCRIHCAPAIINEGRHPSRYQCLVDDHADTPKGRHHADFLYYCARPTCCNGRWYSRDETHTRTLRKRGAAEHDIVRPLTAEEERQFAAERMANATEAAVPAPAPAALLLPPPVAPVAPAAPAALPIPFVPALTGPDYDALPSAPSVEQVLEASKPLRTGCSSSSGVTVPYTRLARAQRLVARVGARFTCRARVALVLALCVVVAALGAVLAATRQPANIPHATELQMCWSMSWNGDAGRASTQGCRLCTRNGTAYLCQSDLAQRVLVIEASLSPNRYFLQRVKLHASNAATYETTNALLPWTFSSVPSTDEHAMLAQQHSSPADTAHSGNSTHDARAHPQAANSTGDQAGGGTAAAGALQDVWYGFILAVGT